MKEILMVDDVATNLVCAAEVLKTSYKVSTAKSGRLALLMLEEMKPDLILLDINMPGMDGFELYEKIKDNAEWASIPVVFLTAETDMANEAKCIEMGAMDFIRKPFDPEVMLARIDRIMSIQDTKKELEFAAKKDPLTQLLTRASFEEYLVSGKDTSKGFFLLLDLDNFKAVNDNYGHIIGDSVLVNLARVFREVVGFDDRVCRLGGDEFAIFLPGLEDKEEVKGIVRRLIASSEFEIGELLSDYSDFKVSVSVGISEKKDSTFDFQLLYGNADKALYFVKQNGKRGYHFFENEENDINTFEEENAKIDLMQLQLLISENDDKDGGAYKVEYEGFKKIYRFVSRCMDRKNQDVQIVLFSLEGDVPPEPNNEYLIKLSDSVASSLRRGDVATECGNSQYVVILMDANDDNGRKVADRIKVRFEKEISNPLIKLTYEIQTVKGGSNS